MSPAADINVLKDQLLPFLPRVEQEMADLTMNLIAIPTPNPPGDNYEPMVELLRERLEALGVATRVVATPPTLLVRHGIPPKYQRTSILGRWGRGSGPALHFHGHYDVVPAQVPELWEPVLAQGMIVGRGAADMKGGLAATWGALRLLQVAGLEPRQPITLSLTPDEESGGATGLGYLALEGHITPQDVAFAVMPEPTSGDIWHAAKGAVVWEVEVRGRGAHATLPHLGVNAFEEMLKVGKRLLEFKEELASRRSASRVADPLAGLSSMVMGGECQGGQKFNVVPERMQFTVDRRPIPEEPLEDVRREVEQIEEELREEGVDVRSRVLLEADPFLTPPDHPGIGALARALATATGRVPRPLLCPGFLDVRYLAQMGIPSVACGPGQLSVAHSPAECVSVGELSQHALAFALLALICP